MHGDKAKQCYIITSMCTLDDSRAISDTNNALKVQNQWISKPNTCQETEYKDIKWLKT